MSVMIEKERLLSGIAQVTSTPSPQFSKYGSLFLDVKISDWSWVISDWYLDILWVLSECANSVPWANKFEYPVAPLALIVNLKKIGSKTEFRED